MNKFHNLVSLVFQPLLMPTYGMIMLLNLKVFDILPFVWQLIAILGTLLFTGLLPATPILFLMKKGEVQDIFISRREERTKKKTTNLNKTIPTTFTTELGVV